MHLSVAPRQRDHLFKRTHPDRPFSDGSLTIIDMRGKGKRRRRKAAVIATQNIGAPSVGLSLLLPHPCRAATAVAHQKFGSQSPGAAGAAAAADQEPRRRESEGGNKVKRMNGWLYAVRVSSAVAKRRAPRERGQATLALISVGRELSLPAHLQQTAYSSRGNRSRGAKCRAVREDGAAVLLGGDPGRQQNLAEIAPP